jgi:hypothetical protein
MPSWVPHSRKSPFLLTWRVSKKTEFSKKWHMKFFDPVGLRTLTFRSKKKVSKKTEFQKNDTWNFWGHACVRHWPPQANFYDPKSSCSVHLGVHTNVGEQNVASTAMHDSATNSHILMPSYNVVTRWTICAGSWRHIPISTIANPLVKTARRYC